MGQMHSTTIICVRKDSKVALAGDGQVTLGDTVIKHGAKKIRRLYNNKILSGFAGRRPTVLPCSHVLNPSWSNFTAISAGRPWNWPRTGAQIDRCGISKLSWSWPMTKIHF
jgi:hypothetical protein